MKKKINKQTNNSEPISPTAPPSSSIPAKRSAPAPQKKNIILPVFPIKSYSNAEADKAQILSENQNKSGIYKWKNSINGKRYIGSELRRLRQKIKKKDLWNILILTIYAAGSFRSQS